MIGAPLLLAAALSSSTPELPAPRSAAVRCKASCEAHVRAPELRAKVCGRCFIADSGGDRGAWVLLLGDGEAAGRAATSTLEDPDWAVRWGGVRLLARRRGQHELSALASWILRARAADAHRAALTAAHVAGARKQPTAALLQSAGKEGPSAAAAVWAAREPLRKALEVEVYGQDLLLSQEALRHLAAFLQVKEGRALLDAMRSRPPETDEIAAELLRARAASGGAPAGRQLLEAAGPEHKPYVERLFARFAARIDRARPGLAALEADARKEAIRELWLYGPLAAPELERMLADEDAVVRLVAARALAAGEGRSLTQATQARIAPDSGLPPEQQARWIDVLGASGSKDCGSTLERVSSDPSYPPRTRGAAATALGACGGAAALGPLMKALSDRAPEVRAGAVAALGYMPRTPAAQRAAANALSDGEPAVLAEAVRTVGAQRQSARLPSLEPLLEHPDGGVRRAAVEACALLGGARVVPKLARRLEGDLDPEVRAQAAKALGELGGPFAPGPLAAAARNDPDGRVRQLALGSLRRLGFR